MRKADSEQEPPAEIAEIPSDVLHDEVYNLWVQLHRVNDLILRAREKELAEYGIPIRQMATLFAVRAFDNKATLTRIAEFLGRRPHTISSILSRMERDGLVKKTSDKLRKNVVRVALTPKGREAYAHSTRREAINTIMAVLEEPQRAQLKLFLDALEKEASMELNRRVREMPIKRVR